MKQSTMLRRKEWGIVLVFDSMSAGQARHALGRSSLGADVQVCNSKWPQQNIWLERNFYQFEDGSHKDLGFVGSLAAPWNHADARFMQPTFAEHVRADSDSEALAAAAELLESADGPQHVLVLLAGSAPAFRSLLDDIAKLLEWFSVAVTARQDGKGGTEVPWFYPVPGSKPEARKKKKPEVVAAVAESEDVEDAEAVREALAEYRAGETVGLEDFAKELEIDLEE